MLIISLRMSSDFCIDVLRVQIYVCRYVYLIYKFARVSAEDDISCGGFLFTLLLAASFQIKIHFRIRGVYNI